MRNSMPKLIKAHLKAAILEQLKSPLSIESEIEIPPLKRGQILVKLAFSGVCQSQLHEVRGGRGADPYIPHMLGHEGSGTVIEIGEGVSKVAPGDKVVVGWIKGSGIEAGGSQYKQGTKI